MKFEETAVPGLFVVDLVRHEDDRGFFARTWCAEEFTAHGIDPSIAQCNLSFNHRKGTLRGMHYQLAPALESKLVRCTQGSIVDVVIDLRPDSPTRHQHVAVELTAENHRALFIPPLFAHGYQTLEDRSEVVYQVGTPYTPGAESGLRHDDPFFGIAWPLPVSVISDKDRTWPLYEETLA